MKKSIWFIIWIPALVLAQKENLKPTLIDNTDRTGWIYVSPENQPGIRGDQYLFAEWKLARVVFKDEIVRENLMVNYNLENEQLEISTTEGIKLVPDGFILSWEVDGKTFVSLHNFTERCFNVERKYAEVLSDGHDMVLLKVFEFSRRNPAYNEKLGIGDNNYRMIKSEELFLLKKGKCQEISGSASRREKILSNFLKNQRIPKLIDQYNLNIRDEADLISLLDQVNRNM